MKLWYVQVYMYEVPLIYPQLSKESKYVVPYRGKRHNKICAEQSASLEKEPVTHLQWK